MGAKVIAAYLAQARIAFPPVSLNSQDELGNLYPGQNARQKSHEPAMKLKACVDLLEASCLRCLTKDLQAWDLKVRFFVTGHKLMRH